MKKIIRISFFLIINSAISQTEKNKAIITTIKKDTMEYLNLEKYKDWEADTDNSPTQNDKFLKKGDNKVVITKDVNKTYVTQSNKISPYQSISVYSNNTKIRTAFYKEFYGKPIGEMLECDENGKLIRELDYEKNYKFTITEVIEKIKKEYNIDLEDKRQRGGVDRFKSDEANEKSYYEVYIGNKEGGREIDYILIGGTTGETLFKTSFYMGDNEHAELPPFFQYKESLKRKEDEENAYFQTYKGKDYTKKEWKVFEEEWYQNYQENKNKGFWDDIFKRP